MRSSQLGEWGKNPYADCYDNGPYDRHKELSFEQNFVGRASAVVHDTVYVSHKEIDDSKYKVAVGNGLVH